MTDFERKLAALTPVAVDRDVVLFAAGRGSASSQRWWKRACGLLVVTQALTFGAVLSERRTSPPPAPPAPEPVAPNLTPPLPPDPSSYLALLRTWDAPLPTPSGGGDSRRSPPLTAGSRSLPPTLEPGT